MNRMLLLIAGTLLISHVQGQTEGNVVFGTDQILQVDVTFYDADFWSLLLAEYDGEQNDLPAAISITGVDGTAVFDSVGIRLKGNSSMNHPGNKKPFKVDFNQYISGQSYDLLKKLNFNNGFKDPTFVREKIFYDVCADAGILAPRANFAEVTFNGTPWGFYTVVEQIDDQFLDRSIGDDAGMLFKAGSNFEPGDSEASLEYLGPDTLLYQDAYELKMNETGNWGLLVALIDFINNSSDDAFEAGLENWLDLPAYLRSAALDNLFANLDSYLLSARNYYLYENTTLDRWQWIKWDANEAFGSYAMGVPGNLTQLDLFFDGGNANRPLLERIMQSPSLRQAYEDELCALRAEWFNPDHLHPRLDALKSLIQEAVYSDQNKMYPNALFDSNFEFDQMGGGGGGGGGGGTLYGLKPFIEARAAYVDAQLACSNAVEPGGDASLPLVAHPNPATHWLHILGPENSSSCDWYIYNGMGQLMWNSSAPTSSLTLDVSGWAAGTYVARFQSNSQHAHLRFIVQ